MIKFTTTGSFNNITKFLKKVPNVNYVNILKGYGRAGISALSSATPVSSGKTADSWTYEITAKRGEYKITWCNENSSGRTPIAILIQYGHATRNGGFVQGINYINPAIKPIFDQMANNAWKEVTK